MRRTLILIPHEIAGLPVFGFGWLLIAIAALLLLRLLWAWRAGRPLGQLLAGEGLMWGLAAVAVAFLLPQVELVNMDGEPVGMAIRGYGVMLLTGVAAAVALAAYRAHRAGISHEWIYSLAPWAFIGGIAGARLFYVIQYRDRFYGGTLLETLGNMLAFNEGGLVVYGAFIGGFLGSLWFVLRHRLPVLTMGDVIVPCIFLGVFFGRIGCLMNGCCYGGRCEAGPAAIHFPAGSPVYRTQLESGELIGLSIDPETRRVSEIRSGSLAERAGIRAGERVSRLALDPRATELTRQQMRRVPVENLQPGLVAAVEGRTYRWTAQELPQQALPVYAAQLLSSVSGLVLCLSLLAISPWLRRPGALMFIGFAGYAVVRFALEIVRVDEAGQFGTALSISQWVSIVILLISIAGLIWLYQRPQPTTDA